MDLKTFDAILKNNFLSRSEPFIVGVSGGPDSLCLLHLLKASKFQVFVVHVNHHLRAEANDEAQSVKEFCKIHEIECVIKECDVVDYARKNRETIEEAARNMRYQILFSEALRVGAQAVMVGHNADDQVETVLMHILRGSGLSGLRGMMFKSIQPQWDRTIPLVRPLLGTTRSEIIAYCEVHGLKPIHDTSNDDPKFTRNRIRLDLLPTLATYNPQVVQQLLKMAEVLATEDDYIQTETEIAWQAAIKQEADGFQVFDRKVLLLNPIAINRRLVKNALQRLAPEKRDIDFLVIERARHFFQCPTRANHLDLFEEVEILTNGSNEIILARKKDRLDELWPQVPTPFKMELDLNGVTALNRHWEILADIHLKPLPYSTDPYQCVLDADKVGKLFITTFQAGDRFKPFNLNSKETKLGDFWTRKKLPLRARATWPILRNETDQIVWTSGYQFGIDFCVGEETQRFLHLHLRRKKA